jgi:hypothetical protein
MKNILIFVLFGLLISCTQMTRKVWEKEYSQDVILGSYVIPEKGLVILGKKENYLITNNYRKVLNAYPNRPSR